MEEQSKKLTLLAATNNKGKLLEMRQILKPYFGDIISVSQAGIELEVDEDADTFTGNALKKASEFCKKSGLPCIADDSGLCIDALNGEPGVYSARYMGEGHTDEERTQFVLDKLLGVPTNERGAYFACAAALVFPDGRQLVVEGRCYGHIAFEQKGDNGFGYDPIFIPKGHGCTFSQMSDEQKNEISHRGRAMRLLAERLVGEGF